MRAAHPTLTPQELAIMKVVWRLERATVRDVYEALRAKRIPFVVCSGSQFNDIAAIFEGVAVVPKPYTEELLADAVTAALGAGRDGSRL